ncbi:MAG: site-specific integrase [Nitrososphaera sp.]
MGTSAIQQRESTSAKLKQTKAEKLLGNSDVKRWYDNMARGSPLTAEVRLRRLCHFCEVHTITPAQLVDLATRDLATATNLLQDHIAWMEEKENAPGYIRNTLTAVRSWLNHSDIQVRRRLKVADADSTPTLEEERVPEGAELAEIFNRATMRAATIISLMSKAGLRPEVLGNYNATDGLMMKDLPDIVIQQGVARCLVSPPRVIVRKTLSKTKHQYFTFLTGQGTRKLLASLNDRLARGESLNGESPVVAPNLEYRAFRGKNAGKRFLPTRRICNDVRDTFRPRFKWRPYVLRSYFDTQLLIAESRGKIAHDFRVFFMGHKGSIEAKYTTNKGVLPEALLNEMREAFRRCETFLDLEISEEDPLIKQKDRLQSIIEKATPERMQEMLRALGVCNT